MIGGFEFQPPGRITPRLRVRPGVRFGKPLDFSRYYGMENDKLVLRAVTDEIIYEIMELSGQEYVDEYAAGHKARQHAEKRAHRHDGAAKAKAAGASAGEGSAADASAAGEAAAEAGDAEASAVEASPGEVPGEASAGEASAADQASVPVADTAAGPDASTAGADGAAAAASNGGDVAVANADVTPRTSRGSSAG